jgi:hypothetical protein
LRGFFAVPGRSIDHNYCENIPTVLDDHLQSNPAGTSNIFLILLSPYQLLVDRQSLKFKFIHSSMWSNYIKEKGEKKTKRMKITFNLKKCKRGLSLNEHEALSTTICGIRNHSHKY